MGISTLDLSLSVTATRPTFPETSDAASTHLALAGFARVIAALRVLLPEETARRSWPHRRQQRWDGRSALERLLAGDA